MDRLPPIPTPPSQLWREFRIRLAPILVLLAAAVAVSYLWRENLTAPTLTGEVETRKSNVSSPRPGKLSQLNVVRLQRVKEGDIIAQVITTDPDIQRFSLNVIHAEIRLLQANLQPVLGQQRYNLTYDRLRLDWMDQRAQLAGTRVKLSLAEAELRRTEELFKDKIVSEQALDAARSAKEGLEAEVKERNNLVTELGEKIKTQGLSALQSSDPDLTAQDVLQASINVQEEKLRLTEAELNPVPLKVPMDGMVSVIHHRSGEAINAGEPIITLSALSSDRILGYLRQPLSFEPKVGMKVEVRTRSVKRSVCEAEIIQVGTEMEAISATLSPMSTAHFHEVGLPVLVSMPGTPKLLPGELVDLRIFPDKPLNRNGSGPY
jgi:multidrug resistance efflux pump